MAAHSCFSNNALAKEIERESSDYNQLPILEGLPTEAGWYWLARRRKQEHNEERPHTNSGERSFFQAKRTKLLLEDRPSIIVAGRRIINNSGRTITLAVLHD